MALLDRIKNIKRLEEFFGMLGFVYYLMLGVVIFFLVQFISTSLFASLRISEKNDALPVPFDVERAHTILGVDPIPAQPSVVAPLTPAATTTVPTTVAEPPSGTSRVLILTTPTGFLNVRSIPASTGELVTKVLPGETYMYTMEENGWIYILIPNESKEGWITERYVQKVQ